MLDVRCVLYDVLYVARNFKVLSESLCKTPAQRSSMYGGNSLLIINSFLRMTKINPGINLKVLPRFFSQFFVRFVAKYMPETMAILVLRWLIKLNFSRTLRTKALIMPVLVITVTVIAISLLRNMKSEPSKLTEHEFMAMQFMQPPKQTKPKLDYSLFLLNVFCFVV